MLVGFFLGMLISTVAFITINYGRFSWRKVNQLTEKNIIELVEYSKDIIYYFQIKPTMKHRFISTSVEVDLGKGTQKLLLEDPDYVFKITHPDDLQTIHAKLSGKIDYTKPIHQRFLSMDGEYVWFEEYATPVYKNGQIVGLQGVLRNINEKKLLEEELQYQVSHDSLTDVYNRGFFEKKKKYLNEQAGISVGFIVCDLDNLKYVNDCFGHQQGDIYITTAAHILKEFVSDSGIVTRIGGDEFVIIVENISEEQLVRKVGALTKVVEQQSFGLPLGESVSMSIGYAWTSNAKGDMDFLYAAADAAMYENKRKRKQLELV